MAFGFPGEFVDQRAKDQSAQGGDNQQVVGLDPAEQPGQFAVKEILEESDQPAEDHRAQPGAYTYQQGSQEDCYRFWQPSSIQHLRQEEAEFTDELVASPEEF
jgi:hypothetical protein